MCVMFAGLPEFEDSTSGVNSIASSESEMSYSVRTHGSDLHRLLSLEHLKCSVSFYTRCSQQYMKLHLWDRDNPRGTIDSNYPQHVSINVWCGVIGDQLIGQYIFPQRLDR